MKSSICQSVLPRVVLPVLAGVLLFGLLSCSQPLPAPAEPPSDLPWWKNAVFYEVFVRSFYDSNGDGIGDIRGLIEKLDYLNDGNPATDSDLGVTALWLMPVVEAASYHGYDAIDYRTIEKDYGNNDDFKKLIEEAHNRGIRIIVDHVLNHTSTQHPWFESSRDPESPFRDWFIWEKDKPTYRGPWGQNVWHTTPRGSYYGVFWQGMPDLNYQNPEVKETVFDISCFWLKEMGVDGFRLDAIKHLVEEGVIQENTEGTLELMASHQRLVKTVNPDALTVGEVWSSTRESSRYVDEQVDMVFDFDLSRSILQSVLRGNNRHLTQAYKNLLQYYPPNQFATFLANHDQDRLMNQVYKNEEIAKLAASLLLTSPGTPFIYYGEEIGMMGVKPDERIRRPMQWSDETYSGFSETLPWNPVDKGYREKNVQEQLNRKNSLLSHYRTMIALRRGNPALAWGEVNILPTSTSKVCAFLRESEEQRILVLVNLWKDPVEEYEISLPESIPVPGDYSILYGSGKIAPPQDGGWKPIKRLEGRSITLIELLN